MSTSRLLNENDRSGQSYGNENRGGNRLDLDITRISEVAVFWSWRVFCL